MRNKKPNTRKKKPDPFVINVRGTAEYREFLVEFLELTHAIHPEVNSITKLVTMCVRVMAWKSFGMVAPPNSNPQTKKIVTP